MPVLPRRLAIFVALVALGSLAVTTASAHAAAKPAQKRAKKCTKKQAKKHPRKCRKKRTGRLGGTPDNPQVGDVVDAHTSNLTIGSGQTTLLSLPARGDADTAWEFRGAITLAHADRANGRSVNCNIVSDTAFIGRATTTIPPATLGLPIQTAMMQAYSLQRGSSEVEFACTSTPAPVIAVDVRLTAQRVGSLLNVTP